MVQILDQFGQPIPATPEPDKLRYRRISATTQDRASLGSILTEVTPARLMSIFAEADNGYIGRQIELAQTLRERDDHIYSVDQTRRLAASAVDFIIEAGDDTPEAEQAAEAFEKDFELLDAGPILERAMDAILDQWHVEELMWATDGKLNHRPHWRPVACEEVDARKLLWPMTATGEVADVIAIVPGVMVNWSPQQTEPLEPGKFFWHSYRARRGRPGRGALVRAVAAYWMFKRFSLIDLATLLEQWGRPWPLIKYDPSASEDEVTTWLAQLADSMADRVLAVPLGSEAEVKSAGASGADTPHINMVKLCNEGISKVLVGSTTIAEAATDAESVSSPTHAGVRLDIRNADASALASSVRETIAKPYTLWNYGPNVAPPKIQPNLAPKPDPQARSQVFLNAAQLGLKVESDQVYSELALDKPEGVPEVLELQPVGAGGAGNPFAALFGGGGQTANERR